MDFASKDLEGIPRNKSGLTYGPFCCVNESHYADHMYFPPNLPSFTHDICPEASLIYPLDSPQRSTRQIQAWLSYVLVVHPPAQLIERKLQVIPRSGVKENLSSFLRVFRVQMRQFVNKKAAFSTAVLYVCQRGGQA